MNTKQQLLPSYYTLTIDTMVQHVRELDADVRMKRKPWNRESMERQEDPKKFGEQAGKMRDKSSVWN